MNKAIEIMTVMHEAFVMNEVTAREASDALWQGMQSKGTAGKINYGDQPISGGYVYDVGSSEWEKEFDFHPDDLRRNPAYKKLYNYVQTGQLKHGDIVTGGWKGGRAASGSRLQQAKDIMKGLGFTLLDYFKLGSRVIYLWVK